MIKINEYWLLEYLQVAPEILAEIQKTQLRSIGTQKGTIIRLYRIMYNKCLFRGYISTGNANIPNITGSNTILWTKRGQ